MSKCEIFKSSLIEGINKSLPLLEEAKVNVHMQKEKDSVVVSLMNYLCEENSFKYNVEKIKKDFKSQKSFKKITDNLFMLNQDGYKVMVETFDDNSIAVELKKGFDLQTEHLDALDLGESIGLNYYKALLFLKKYAE